MKSITCTFIVADEHLPALKQILTQFQAVIDDNLTLAEAGREFGICAGTIDRWVNKARLIPFSQPVPGGKKYVRRSDVVALLTARAEKKARPKKRKSILDI